MTRIIDGRLRGKGRSTPNKERFHHRLNQQVRDGIIEQITVGKTLDSNVKVKVVPDKQSAETDIPRRDLSEPTFEHGPGGRRETVHPGNKEFVAGDRIPRPEKGGGGGGGGEGGDEEGALVIELTPEQAWNFLYPPDIELPYLEGGRNTRVSRHRGGIASDGAISQLHLVRSKRKQLGRVFARRGECDRLIQELEEEKRRLESLPGEAGRIREIDEEIETLRIRREKRIPLDPIDLQYRSFVERIHLDESAVVILVGDVSGSMGEPPKKLKDTKDFAALVVNFVRKEYRHVQIAFIAFHDKAMEVEEDEFFRAKSYGGTVVSRALGVTKEVIKRYPRPTNIYVIVESDGDNFYSDDTSCAEALTALLADPYVRLCVLFETIPGKESSTTTKLWDVFTEIASKNKNRLRLGAVYKGDRVYDCFRKLFKKGRK